nr:phosphoinositide phosphatase sac7 [Quercus suber]
MNTTHSTRFAKHLSWTVRQDDGAWVASLHRLRRSRQRGDVALGSSSFRRCRRRPDELPESSSVPKVWPIFGVVGMLKLLAGSYLIVITKHECVGSYLGHPIFKVSSLKIFPCNHSLENSPADRKRWRLTLDVRKCPSWNPKSSNKILSQVMAKKIAKWKQVGESQGVLADRVHEGDESSHPLYRSIGYFQAPGCEIPDEFNHQNDGNSISFLVRNSRCIPLAVCVAFGPTNESYHFVIEFVVNGCLEIQHSGRYAEFLNNH